MTTDKKIELLRCEMRKNGLEGYIVPTGDVHMSEYLADHYRFRQWITGFTGSAGTFALTMNKSGLWTDGRYYIQAEDELSGSEIDLYKAYEPGVISYVEFLCRELKEGDNVGLDGKIFSKNAVERMQKRFSAEGIELRVDMDFTYIWEERAELPYTEIFVLEEKYSGESAKSKIARLREKMKEAKITAFVMCKLDDIMWLYNVRANDIHCCPFAMSYALVTMDKAMFYVSDRQINKSTESYFDEMGITLCGYEDIYDYAANLGEDEILGINGNYTNYMLCEKAQCTKKEVADFVENMKAIKNETENNNLKEAYIQDCAALVRGFYKIYNAKDGEMTERDVCEILLEERGKTGGNLGASFDTIAAYGKNAAMMHYSPDENNSDRLEKKGMLLIDSGGHYYKGSTDITRTLILGDITEEEKKAYTLTLKGNIALCSAAFLKGASGSCLDILARQYLWKDGIDYKCGTGHGVGYLLNVHEGPQSFSPRMRGTYPLEVGMNLTVEPGVYVEGKFGVRIENDVIVKERCKTEDGEFYDFEMLSYCPIDKRGIDVTLLTKDEINWLNDFHKKVYEKLEKYLTEEEAKWLWEETLPLTVS